jgi:hypothetical protein
MAGTFSISEIWIPVFFIIGTQDSLFCIEDLSFLCNMGGERPKDGCLEMLSGDTPGPISGWMRPGVPVETIIGDSQSCRKVRDEK